MDNEQLEEKIKSEGLNAPRVTLGDVTKNIANIEYVTHIASSGQVLRWCVIVAQNGHAITGKPSAAVSPENDNREIGEAVAYKNAFNNMWELMGYALKEKLNAK